MYLKALFNSGASATLVNQVAVRHLKKSITKGTVFSKAEGNFSTHGKCQVKLEFMEFNPTEAVFTKGEQDWYVLLHQRFSMTKLI